MTAASKDLAADDGNHTHPSETQDRLDRLDRRVKALEDLARSLFTDLYLFQDHLRRAAEVAALQ